MASYAGVVGADLKRALDALRSGRPSRAWPDLNSELVEPGVRRLADDIASGAWGRRHADLLRLDTYDAGYRLVVSQPQ